MFSAIMYAYRIKNIVIPFILFIIVLLPFVFVEKGTHVLNVNKFHNDSLDRFFIFFSAVGNGITIAICAIILLLIYKLKVIYEFVLAFIIQLSIVTFFKQILFFGLPRPYKYFEILGKEELLNTVIGVRIYEYNTFPSGHTATIFLIVTFFALLYNRKNLSWGLFVFAFFVGLSRIYLVQHFYIDVYFGVLFGSGSAFFAHYLVEKKMYSWSEKKLFKDFTFSKKNSQSSMNV